MSEKVDGIVSPSAKASKLMLLLQSKKSDSQTPASKDLLPGNDSPNKSKIAEVNPEQIQIPVSGEGPPPGLFLDKEGPPPGFKKEGPPETPPVSKTFKKSDTSKDKRERRTNSKQVEDREWGRNVNGAISSSQYLLNVAKEMKKKHKFCYSKEEFMAIAATLERDDAFSDPPSDKMNEYYVAIRAEYNLNELNLPSRTSRTTIRSSTPSKETDRDNIARDQRPRIGSGSFNGSVERTDYNKTKAGANGGSTKEGRWEKATVVESKSSNKSTGNNARPPIAATKESKVQDKKQTHMDQMKEFEEMRLKLRAERGDDGDRGKSGTPVSGGTFHNETDNLMAEMIQSSSQTKAVAQPEPQSQTVRASASSDSGVAHGDMQPQSHKPLDNDVIGSLTGALMDSLFAQPAPVPAPVPTEGNVESRSSRLFSWSAVASTPTPPNIPAASSLTSSASNSSPSLNDLNMDSLLSAATVPVASEPLTGGIGSLDLAGALGSLVHEEPSVPVNSVANDFASLLLGHSSSPPLQVDSTVPTSIIPEILHQATVAPEAPKMTASKAQQQRLQTSQLQSLRIQQLQKHQMNMQKQLQQSKSAEGTAPQVAVSPAMPTATSAPIRILQKPQPMSETPVIVSVSESLPVTSPKITPAAPVNPMVVAPTPQNKSTVNLLSRLGIAPKATSQTAAPPSIVPTNTNSGIVPLSFSQIQQQQQKQEQVGRDSTNTTPVKSTPALPTTSSPFAFHTANTPVTPTPAASTSSGSNATSNKLRKFKVLQQQKKLTTTPSKAVASGAIPTRTSPAPSSQPTSATSPGVRRVDVEGLFKKN